MARRTPSSGRTRTLRPQCFTPTPRPILPPSSTTATTRPTGVTTSAPAIKISPRSSPTERSSSRPRTVSPSLVCCRDDTALVDSSVWIAYLRDDNLVEVDLLTESLKHGEPVWLAPPILQEVLQGADSPDRFTRWDRVLGELPMAPPSHSRTSQMHISDCFHMTF